MLRGSEYFVAMWRINDLIVGIII